MGSINIRAIWTFSARESTVKTDEDRGIIMCRTRLPTELEQNCYEFNCLRRLKETIDCHRVQRPSSIATDSSHASKPADYDNFVDRLFCIDSTLVSPPVCYCNNMSSVHVASEIEEHCPVLNDYVVRSETR